MSEIDIREGSVIRHRNATHVIIGYYSLAELDNQILSQDGEAVALRDELAKRLPEGWLLQITANGYLSEEARKYNTQLNKDHTEITRSFPINLGDHMLTAVFAAGPPSSHR